MEKIKWGSTKILAHFQDAQIITKLWSNTTKLHRKNHVIYTSLPEDITHWTHAQNDV